MKIENKIITQVFAGYLGQKINVKLNRYTTEFVGVSFIPFIKDDTIGVYEFEGDNTYYDCPIDSCKLLLKPISKLNIGDTYEVAKILGKFCEDNFSVGIACENIMEIMTGKSLFNKDINPLNFLMACQFLKLKGYDLPHHLLGGLTLNEAELAEYV